MNFEQGKRYAGFRLLAVENLEDIKGAGHIFEHEKSGARLFYIKSEDKNKVFFISFKTPPSDDCGTPHILEHSVLCGSSKYGVKDPFNELLKGSLNTFLNAMTYADKTMYPVASRNHQDFKNLVDVYLDAVFHPNIYQREEIFLQEGWHYELENEQAPLRYKGVVYNEMKGALSDPESIVSGCIARSLFPDSIYRFESGGDPAAIPMLTYESFLEFHKKYYHPANSYLYLYGDMDILSYLEYLDKSYLNQYQREDGISAVIERQTPFSGVKYLEDTYPLLENEEEQGYLAYNAVIGTCLDPLLSLSFDILNYLLLSTNASPLKTALIQSGICKDAEGWFDSSTLDMVFSIVGKKADTKQAKEFQSIVEETLKNLVKEGIDKKLIASSLDIWEFHLREEDYGYRPKGLIYGIRAMKTWLHGGNPQDSLRHFALLKEIKRALTEPYFETLIEKYLLGSSNKSLVSVSGEIGKQARIEREQQKALEKKKAEMSRQELSALISRTKALYAYQQSPETAEELEKIPILSIDEISEEPEYHENRLEGTKDRPILFTPLKTNGITYFHLLFSLEGFSMELLPYAGLLAGLLGKLATQKYSYEELPLAVNQYTGGMRCQINVYEKGPKNSGSYFVVRTKFLNRKTKEVFALLSELLARTDFTRIENLLQCVKEMRVQKENTLLSQSHSAAVQRALSRFSFAGSVKEQTGGIAFYEFLCGIEKQLEKNPAPVIEKLKKAMDILWQESDTLSCFAAEEQEFPLLEQALSDLLESGRKQEEKENKKIPLLLKDSEAFFSSSKVQYNVKAANFLELGYHYSGVLLLAKGILNQEYLWNKVRVQGGAYGSGCSFTRNGSLYFYSYRDPNLKDTLDIYDKAADFLDVFSVSERELQKYKIGAVNELNQPRTNQDWADTAIVRYLCGITREGIKKEQEEILSATQQEVQEVKKLLKASMHGSQLCVIGNKETIEKDRNLFADVKPLLP